jgi:hypothetical protein
MILIDQFPLFPFKIVAPDCAQFAKAKDDVERKGAAGFS